MLRASTTGMIDFRKFDPWDAWWWRNLRWILNELELQQTAEISKIQHAHWVTLASHGNLTSESFDKAKTNAGTAFNRLLKATYPWLADTIGEDGTRSEREEAVRLHEETFGKPGDPGYDAMVDNMLRATKRPMTQREKEKDRARRRREREAANGS